MRSRLHDLQNQKFGALTVKARSASDKNGNTRWLCDCSCGVEFIAYAAQLKNGRTRSCSSSVHDGDPLPAPSIHTLGNRVRTARMARGMSYKDLGKMVDLNAPYICEIEKGKKLAISAASLLKLATALNVSCDWLLKGSEKQPLTCPLCKGEGQIVL